jgi:tetratricopeptide (TPR) repeat protein
MNVFVLSHRCGHCVHHQVVMSDDEYEACWRRCVGVPCPVCGARAREEDIQIVVPDTDYNAINDGSFPWGKANRPAANFAGFAGTGPEPAFERGEFAKTLRRQMYGQAKRSRKDEYERISKAFAKLVGFQFGHAAFEAGDFARAVLWLERAVPALDEPTHAAGACLYLGLARVELGEVRKAEAAFRGAVDPADVDPVIRSAAADQLGSARKQLGNIAGARTAFQLAVDLGIAPTDTKAAINLGTLEDEAGNHTKAKSLWEFAYRSAANDQQRAFAAHNLGWYWEQADDLTKARHFYRLAAKSKVPEVATRAADRLRILPAPRRRFFGRNR